jgi:hypothetical protein
MSKINVNNLGFDENDEVTIQGSSKRVAIHTQSFISNSRLKSANKVTKVKQLHY